MEVTKKRTADRGGTKPINPGKIGATDRFHRRVEVLVSSAVRSQCAKVEVWHCADAGAVRDTLISSIELTDDHDTPRTIVDQVVLVIQEEAATLARGFHAFSVRGVLEDGSDVVRERIRIRGSDSSPGDESARMARAEIGEEVEHEHALERASGLALHPREVATLAGMTRQQMRHNEALMSMMIKGFAQTGDTSARMIEQLGLRVLTLTEKLERQADTYLDSHRKQKLVEAEARASEMRGRAIELGANTLAEYLPVALHRISRKYGIAGDAELDPMIEKLVGSFDEEQIKRIGPILKPQQQALFAEAWLTVQTRKEEKEKEKKEKEAERKKEPETSSG